MHIIYSIYNISLYSGITLPWLYSLQHNNDTFPCAVVARRLYCLMLSSEHVPENVQQHCNRQKANDTKQLIALKKKKLQTLENILNNCYFAYIDDMIRVMFSKRENQLVTCFYFEGLIPAYNFSLAWIEMSLFMDDTLSRIYIHNIHDDSCVIIFFFVLKGNSIKKQSLQEVMRSPRTVCDSRFTSLCCVSQLMTFKVEESFA